MYTELKAALEQAHEVNIIQAENPDGDSLGSALALEGILTALGKTANLYCPVNIPKYLRYFGGWDRVSVEYNTQANLNIIVDTSAEVLLSKLLEKPEIAHHLERTSTVVIDHHTESTPDLKFSHILIMERAVATSEIVFRLAKELNWQLDAETARNLLAGIMSDTLGLTSQNVTAETYRLSAELIDAGANVAEIEESRREFMKKSQRILAYKAKLIERIEYHLDGKLATVHIPWEDIQEFSDEYNPNVLILEEMRLVESVEVAVAIKTYPDGKLTGKIRTAMPVAERVAGFFGGGGHKYAAGFRIYESYEKSLKELVGAVYDILKGEGDETL
ncbi:MAG: DHH family phosphoesterase [Candidatus Nomurabacteria bacterium]|jgi:phosphoesterase RecJ-like protein|nr:DHH family phosphoesterase [Candidatus Nomurabacteria bacterium]